MLAFRNRNKAVISSIVIQLLLIFFVLLAISFSEVILNLTNNEALYYFSWIGNIGFLISVINYYRLTKTLISPYMVVFTSFFIFQFGQWFLYSMAIDYDYIHLGFYARYWSYDMGILISGIKLTIFSLLLFNLGALISSLNLWEENRHTGNNNNSFTNRKAKNVGWFLFTISFIPAFYLNISQALISIEYGYLEHYRGNVESIPLILRLSVFFIPSCVLLLTTNEKSINLDRFIKVIMIFYALSSLAVGGRTEGIATVLTIIVYEMIKNKQKNMNIKRILKYAGILFVLVTLISTLAEFRNKEDKTIESFVVALQDNTINKNPIIKTIGEMGHSSQTIFMTMHLVPKSVNYQKGGTYIASISRVIPSAIDPSGTIGKAHTKSSEATSFLTKYHNLSFGTDTTLIAESYYNFGYYGVIMILFIGFIVGKLLGFSSHDHLLSNNLTFYVKLISMYSLYTLPRRSFSFLIGELLYTIIFVFIFISIAKRVKFR